MLDIRSEHPLFTEFPDEKPVKVKPTTIEEIRARKGHASPPVSAANTTKTASEVKDQPDPVSQLAERVASLEAEIVQGEVSQQILQDLIVQVQELGHKLDSIVSSLQNTVGFGAHQNFICRNCHSKGHVAARLNCTACGEENWWGWWPPQQ
jgi:hypothetical protein